MKDYHEGYKDGMKEAVDTIVNFAQRQVGNKPMHGFATGYAACLKDLREIVSDKTRSTTESELPQNDKGDNAPPIT